jgi:hypothetical protein
LFFNIKECNMDIATRALDSLAGDGFMPHGHCYLWMPELLWTYVVSESIIVLRQPNASPATLCRYRITARKQTEIPPKEQLDELHRWHETTAGRESRIMELKREVSELLARRSLSPRNPSVAANGDETQA